MKKTLQLSGVFLVFSTVLFSCGPSVEEIRFHEKRDSLAVAQRKKAVADSTKAAEAEKNRLNDSLQRAEKPDSFPQNPK